MGQANQSDSSDRSERRASGSHDRTAETATKQAVDEAFRASGVSQATENGTPWNENRPREVVGPMEWLDDGPDHGAPPSKRLASPPSSGHSIGPERVVEVDDSPRRSGLSRGTPPQGILVREQQQAERPGTLMAPPNPSGSIDSDLSLREPPRLITHVGYFRLRAEHFGDLCAEMIAAGIEGTAYGAAKRAAHFGAIANALYAQRAKELIVAHPWWLQ